MKPIHAVLVGGVLALAATGAALAQSEATSTTESRIEAAAGMQGRNLDKELQSTTSEKASADVTLAPIRERAKKAVPKTLAIAEKKLNAISKQIDGDVEETGEFIIANRIAPEFAMTGEAMMSERGSMDVGMGDLVIAHTLKANAKKNEITTEQLFQLRQEGMSWGQIAYGLGFKLDATAAAVKTEADVASGTLKADGKVALIGAPKTSTNAGANASAGAHAGPVGTSASSNVGLGVNLGK